MTGVVVSGRGLAAIPAPEKPTNELLRVGQMGTEFPAADRPAVLEVSSRHSDLNQELLQQKSSKK
jgi:hypothetical protein